jgi:putative addiction module killer protein
MELKLTTQFLKWFNGLRDNDAKARIQVRLDRLQFGILDDIKPTREGVSELRIDYGPGYRVYITQRGPVLIVVLGGGSKKTQDRDIQAAIELARNL